MSPPLDVRYAFTMDSLVQWMVIEVDSGGYVGHGTKSFRVSPRTGDYLTFADADGTAQAYEVVAVLHPGEPAETSGDLLVKRVGTDLELRERIRGSGAFTGSWPAPVVDGRPWGEEG